VDKGVMVANCGKGVGNGDEVAIISTVGGAGVGVLVDVQATLNNRIRQRMQLG